MVAFACCDNAVCDEKIGRVMSEVSHQFQFIITTCDENMVKQLCDANAVPPENKIVISEWMPPDGSELETSSQSL